MQEFNNLPQMMHMCYALSYWNVNLSEYLARSPLFGTFSVCFSSMVNKILEHAN